jgi:hypothetical protein
MAELTTGTEVITPVSTTPTSTVPGTPQAEVLTGSQAQNILATYGINPNALYSSNNVTSTLVRPESAADDLLGIRSQHQYDTGYSQSKAEADAIQKQIDAYTSQTESGIQSIGDWRQNAEAITGEKASYNEQRGIGLNTLLKQQGTLQTKLAELAEEVNLRTTISETNINLIKQLKLQYPGAKIKFGDSMDKIEKRLVKYGKEQEKKAKKSAYKDALEAMGMSTSGSSKELGNRLKQANAEAYAMAQESNKMSLESARIALQKAKQSLGTGTGGGGYFPDDNGTTGTTGATGTLNTGSSISGGSGDAISHFGF